MIIGSASWFPTPSPSSSGTHSVIPAAESSSSPAESSSSTDESSSSTAESSSFGTVSSGHPAIASAPAASIARRVALTPRAAGREIDASSKTGAPASDCARTSLTVSWSALTAARVARNACVSLLFIVNILNSR